MYPMTTLDVVAELVEQMEIEPAEGICLLHRLLGSGDDTTEGQKGNED